jgi:hypothetical protein
VVSGNRFQSFGAEIENSVNPNGFGFQCGKFCISLFGCSGMFFGITWSAQRVLPTKQVHNQLEVLNVEKADGFQR